MRGLALGWILATCAPADLARAQDVPGYKVVRTAIPFAALEARLAAAISKNGMNLVNRASASDGAQARGVAIPGDAVIGVFRNDYAVRMLAANRDAGIEAPIRFHLVEEAGGGSSIGYYPPSVVFGRYQGDAIKSLGRELDPVFEQIVKDVVAAP